MEKQEGQKTLEDKAATLSPSFEFRVRGAGAGV
jgi:hypothetical protein